MSNLGVTFSKLYNAREKEDYGYGLGQFAHTSQGVFIFAKLGADITAGTTTFIAPADFTTGTTATGKLSVEPGVSGTYSATADQYAWFLVQGIDDTASVDTFKAFTIA